jgi:histone RNA hairpin-binding protein
MADPKTPDKYQMCSKRSWDAQLRKWRKLLHQYDDPSQEGEIVIDAEEEEISLEEEAEKENMVEDSKEK